MGLKEEREDRKRRKREGDNENEGAALDTSLKEESCCQRIPGFLRKGMKQLTQHIYSVIDVLKGLLKEIERRKKTKGSLRAKKDRGCRREEGSTNLRLEEEKRGRWTRILDKSKVSVTNLLLLLPNR